MQEDNGIDQVNLDNSNEISEQEPNVALSNLPESSESSEEVSDSSESPTEPENN